MKKFFLAILTIFFAYFCAYITSGTSEKQDLFNFGDSQSMYKIICLFTGETDTTDANKLYYRGENYLNERQYDLAIKDMQKVLTLDSTYSRARFIMAKANLGLGDTNNAIGNLQLFVISNSLPTDGYMELGHIFKSMGLKDSSFYYYKKAYASNNSYPQASYNIALYYYNSNNQNAALEYISKAIEFDENNLEYRNLRRLVYIRQNMTELANQDYQFIISNNSEYFGNYKAKAEQENNNSNYQAAIENYKLALQEQVDSRELLEARAWVYHSMSKYDSALFDFERVAQLYPDYLSYFNLAYTFDLMNKVEDAIKNYDKSVEFKNDYYLSYNNRGYEHFRLEHYKQAEADYTKSIELKHDYYLNYYNRGILYYELKKYKKAIEDYKNALKYTDNSQNIIYSTALAYDKLKNKEEAIYNFNEFLKQAGESDTVRINYATNRVAELSK